MNAMYHFYTDDELIVNYRQAKNKQDQITIFADLCGASKDEIREYLRGLGCDVPYPVRRRRMTKPFDKELTEKLWREGHTDPEIAEIVGASAVRIFQWRNENRLPANRGKQSAEP